MDVRREDRRENIRRKKRLGAGRRRALWLWMICGILLCQIVGTAAYSRYRMEKTGDGESRIACFATGMKFIEVMNLPEKPGESTDMKFSVTNHEGDRTSETLLYYTVTMETAGNLPLEFTLSRDESQGDHADDNWIGNGKLTGNTASGQGSLPLGTAVIHRYILKVSWPMEQDTDNYEYADEIDYVRIRVQAKQASPH